ncbi:MAG: response regulator transcription factor [candidate division Zixibacteria bacterium]|nr:response regulator transcription factor [candidate division Zixibacteria bacterium]
MNNKILSILTSDRLPNIKEDYSDHFKIKISREISFDKLLKELRVFKPQLVIIECDACDLKEISLCSRVRRNFHGPIIVIIPAKSNLFENALRECGADDIFYDSPDEHILVSRVEVLIRQYHQVSVEKINQTDFQPLQVGELLIKRNLRSVYYNGQEIPLTTSEFDLLWFLAKNKNRTVSREEMYRELLNIEFDGLDRCIDNRVARLRKKLVSVAPKSLLIKSIRSVGYLLAEK